MRIFQVISSGYESDVIASDFQDDIPGDIVHDLAVIRYDCIKTGFFRTDANYRRKIRSRSQILQKNMIQTGMMQCV